MKKLITLMGVGKSGKTTSIMKCYELMRVNFPNAQITELGNRNRNPIEITVTVTINGVIVGIETRGDLDLIVRSRLNKFRKARCGVILCACRSRGAVPLAVNDFAHAHNYDVEWLEKIREPSATPAVHEIANKATADRLFSAVQAAGGFY